MLVKNLTQSGLCLIINKLSKVESIKLLASQDFFSCRTKGFSNTILLFIIMNTSDCKAFKAFFQVGTILAKVVNLQEKEKNFHFIC